ncbi:MAG: trehalose-phosphatase [Novosphingobium sp.]|nr:trehalose-phosphatase [Novosphingobium sp.]
MLLRANAPIASTPPLGLIENACLFLDFDGTLVEIAPSPHEVVVGNGLRQLLARLQEKLDGRLAILSGRDAAQIRTMLEMPQLVVAGSHGLEVLWADGGGLTFDRPEALDAVLAEMREFAKDWTGVVVEAKPLGVALHYRKEPLAEQSCHELGQVLALEYGLKLQPGRKVIELRSHGADKGTALRLMMNSPEFAGYRPVCLGDDHTDESAFAAAADLGGCGILVGPVKDTRALCRLDNVDAALAWLSEASQV